MKPVRELVRTVTKVETPVPPFERSQWPHWVDEDGDCQDARAEVLIRRSYAPVTFKSKANCEVATGKWIDEYDGQWLTDANTIAIDHLVSPMEMHRLGGYLWEPWKRQRFANAETNLLIVSVRGKEQRAGRGANDYDGWWVPPSACRYLQRREVLLRSWGRGYRVDLRNCSDGSFIPYGSSTQPDASTAPETSKKIAGLIPNFDRAQWPEWLDEDGDCQDTRTEVLIRRSQRPVHFKTAKECEVASGLWLDEYTGQQLTIADDVAIDHVFSPMEAHREGGYEWEPSKRQHFTNADVNLMVVSVAGREQRAGRGVDEWLPVANVCDFLLRRTRDAQRWDLDKVPLSRRLYGETCVTAPPKRGLFRNSRKRTPPK